MTRLNRVQWRQRAEGLARFFAIESGDGSWRHDGDGNIMNAQGWTVGFAQLRPVNNAIRAMRKYGAVVMPDQPLSDGLTPAGERKLVPQRIEDMFVMIPVTTFIKLTRGETDAPGSDVRWESDE